MITWYGSLDGSIGKISPIGEKMYKRLQLLQTLMQTHMPHYAGLNPKEYRSVSKSVKTPDIPVLSLVAESKNHCILVFTYTNVIFFVLATC